MSKTYRDILVKVLLDIEDGKFISEALDSNFKNVSDDEKAKITYITKTIYENLYYIDDTINSISSIKVKKMKALIRSVLRIATCEKLYLSTYKDYAICNELVNIVKKSHLRNLSKFTNANIRKILDKDIKEYGEDSLEEISLKYSYPKWVLELLDKRFGRDILKKIVSKKDNSYVSFRVRNKLENEDMFIKDSIESNCVKLKNPKMITNIVDFRKGNITVQDVSSITVGNIAYELDIKDAKILDLCAAPGGKSIHLSEIKNVNVVACDISRDKLNKIEENISRLGVKNISTKLNDASVFNEDFLEKFDLVLCDLPCSGLGLMDKKPDIRYRLQEKDIKTLANLQRNILNNAIKYLKKDGYLIFSTCTLTQEENIDNFNYLSTVLENVEVRNKKYIEFIQGVSEGDGFFISVFRK